MTAVCLGEATYKITLDKTETSDLPQDGNPQEMHRFIRDILDRLSVEQGIVLPNGRLLVEAFLKSDGSFVFFVSPLGAEPCEKDHSLYACDISGIDNLRRLCCALSAQSEKCTVYCGNTSDKYRLVFNDPTDAVGRICSEYGDYGEISSLFAAQTEEYLTAIARGDGANVLSEILS